MDFQPGHAGCGRHCGKHPRPHRHQRGHLHWLQDGGIRRGILATLGVVLPSFVVIAALSCVLRQFESLTAVRYAFAGIRAGVLALIVRALLSMYRQCPKSALSLAIMGAAFMAVAVLGVPVLPVIIGCALVGLVASMAAERKLKP